MELSNEQQTAFDTFTRGENIFITGPAGSGKSELIKKIYYHAIHNFKSIQICALTGSAAVLIGCKARTLHSWAGIGLGQDTVPNLVKKIHRNFYSKQAWKSTQILVVDEISMMSKKLFNTLNTLGKILRKNSRPFGGIQLVFCGDFYQLPPVGNKVEDMDSEKFCFESDDWNSVFSKTAQIQLVKIFRQKDSLYINMLNKIRQGKITTSTDKLLKSLVNKPVSDSLVTRPTRLFPVRKTADAINNAYLRELTGDTKSYRMTFCNDIEINKSDHNIRSTFTKEQINDDLAYLSKNLLCDETVTLKVGSQVMSIINIQRDEDNTLVVFNGSQGIITRFCEESGAPYVKFNSGIELLMGRHIWMSEKIPGVGVSQIPLILAWAITIHKSQGATLDAAEVDIGSDIFEGGQTYVALSRVKSLEGLYLTSYDVSKIKIKKTVKDFYHMLNN
jgi:ATP-dependent DNA helicase PIF1